MGTSFPVDSSIKNRLDAEKIHAHYQQLPAIIIAPSLGALFVTWVLWHATNKTYLLIGLTIILALSMFRIFLYKSYFSTDRRAANNSKWRIIAIVTAFIAGIAWGSVAIFLYPPDMPEYKIFTIVLLSLVPVVPLAGLAVYMPTFYAYYIPCVTPFVYCLFQQQQRAETLTAVLLLMMMAATIVFAKKYSIFLADSIQLRLLLSDKKTDLEIASAEKTRFLATASHDLRQPVHAMGLLIESLSKRLGAKPNKIYIHNIEKCLISLRTMLEATLDISKLDAKVVEPNIQPICISNILKKLHNELTPVAAQKCLRFHFVNTNLVVDSDPVLLEQILRNILSNSLKYTNKGGIVLGCRRHGDHVLIQVVDTGIGIPPEHIDDIYVEYAQFPSLKKESRGGLGLGLSIVERLARLLDHKLTVDSKLDSGTLFSVEVTRSKHPIDKVLRTTESTAPKTLSIAGILVMIIDDDDSVRVAMSELIKAWGGNVISAATAEQALEKVNQFDNIPEILILDYHLQANRTIEQSKSLIDESIGNDLAMIIITGDTSPERIREAHQAGYILLHKPVDPDKLKLCISELLNRVTA